MPIYEYVCTTCGSEFEALQKFSDAPLTDCACGEAGRVERKLSLSAFQLKGGGWYKDRYGAGNGNGKSAAAAPDTAAKSESKDSSAPSGGESAAPAAACGTGCACA